MSWATTMTLSQTAWQECALLGHREIDVEHVLLATMQDEEVAALLLRHGVTREGTRDAIDRAVADEVSALGVEVGSLGGPRRRAVDDLHHAAVGDLAVSGRAQLLIAGSSSPIQALLAAAEDEGGTVRRLLSAQGADPASVVEEARRLSDRGPHDASVDVGSVPGLERLGRDPGRAVRRSQVLAVPAGQVWPLCSTAAGIRRWLDSDPEAEAEIISERELVERPAPRAVGRRIPGLSVVSLTRHRVFLQDDGVGGGVVLWSGEVEVRRFGRRASWPGRWNHLTVRAEGPTATRVEVVSGGALQGRPRWLRDLVNRFALNVSTRNAVYRLGLLVEGPDADG
ncbi:Clp protease N-terminal domain-containing protein [Serinicoccus marinus]|uniref:Clp protease N-terminal domain-containing protein n=1 Tax=Serinicoccus marinus TaxID=247333 RepID=UPI0003B3593B|nr:Clp protease N-terminal domain-containing protein [Serinicoccus marinus]